MEIAASGATVRRMVLAGAGALVLAGVGPSAASAADLCPNAEVRQQQGATRLPECRAFEQVSPVRKNGNAVLAGFAPRASGGAFAYWAPGAFEGALSSVFVSYKAERTAGGWVTTALNPPLVGDRNPNLLNEVRVFAVSDDFSRTLMNTSYPVDPREGITAGADLYLREPGGAFTWIAPGTTDLTQGLVYAGASNDLRRIVFAARRALTPEVTSPVAQHQLYEWVDGEVRLVSKDANGAPLPGGAFAGELTGQVVNKPFGLSADAVSDDGRTIFITSPVAGAPRLYVRVDEGPLVDVGVSEKNPPDPEPLRTSMYKDATPDGAKVLFTSPDALTDGTVRSAVTQDENLYVYDVASGELTNAAPYQNPSAPPEEQQLGARVTDAFGIADDGSRAYFLSRARLVEGMDVAADHERHLYSYDAAEDRLTFIGTVAGGDGDQPEEYALSPSGRYLAFESSRAPGGGTGPLHLYMHDAEAGTTSCVSCPAGFDEFNADGVDYAKPNEFFGRVSDGGHLFFTTETAVLPEDVNGVADAYMWRDGELDLLSSGIDAGSSMFVGATPDGSEAYFVTNESLVGHDVDNGVADLYVARVGGGFPEPVTPPQCVERCRQPAAPPAAPAAGSSTLTGAEPEALPPRPSARVSRLSRAARARLARGRGVNVKVRVNRAGTLRLIARARVGKRLRVIARDAERASKAGTERLRLRLSRPARARLARGKVLRVTVDVRFSGVREPERLNLTLRPAGDR